MRLRLVKFNLKGQNLVEYAVLLAIVAAAFMGMQTYMKRGIQAAIKVSADELGEQKEAEEIHPLKGKFEGSQRYTKEESNQTISFSAGTQGIDSNQTSTLQEGTTTESIYNMGFEPKKISGN